MRKWRPAYKAIYVIPEIHGNAESLEVILNRILPMRFSIGQEDILIFLGDYIDNGPDSASVLDMLINIKQEFGDSIFMIRGNHEEMMLKALFGSQEDYKQWIYCGGLTTVASYIKKNNANVAPETISQNRLKDIIPQSHINFLQTLEFILFHEEYCFFHGGFDPEKSLQENNITNFAFDNSSSRYVKTKLTLKQNVKFLDDYVFVGAHNAFGKIPHISSTYMMLGGSAPSKLYVFELNSLSADAVKSGKSRIYKADFKVVE